MDPLMKELHFTDGIAVVLDAPMEFTATLQAWEANGASLSAQLIPGSRYVLAFVGERGWSDHHAAEVVAQMTSDDPVLWVAFRVDSAPVAADGDWGPMSAQNFHPMQRRALDNHWTAYRYGPPIPPG